VEPWSLTSLREKLIKIGAKVISHGRYVTFQTAEVAVPRQMFADILSLIARLRAPPAPARRAAGQVRRAIRGELCPGTGKAGISGFGRRQPAALIALCSRRRQIAVAKRRSKARSFLENTGDLANVGLECRFNSSRSRFISLTIIDINRRSEREQKGER